MSRKQREKRQAIKNSKAQQSAQLAFWKEDQEYLDKKIREGKVTARFWLYKGVVFTNRLDLPGIICRAIDSDRYERYKDIIDSAIADLAGREDGVWYFNPVDKWHRKPLPDVLIDDLEIELQLRASGIPFRAKSLHYPPQEKGSVIPPVVATQEERDAKNHPL